MARIDFDKQLARGAKAYDNEVGQWWLKRSEDIVHRRAYDAIAKHFVTAVKKAGYARGVIVDYACGSGPLLERLAKLLPEARIVGIDGSVKLLSITAERLRAQGVDAAVVAARDAFANDGPRIRLVQSGLPSFKFPRGHADALMFCFPNITAHASDQPHYDRHGYKQRGDAAVAKMLSRFREMDPDDEVSTFTAKEQYDDLLTHKVISRDLRALMKPGGLLTRVEYANCNRGELTQWTTWRMLFCEGALDEPIKDAHAETIFQYQSNRYTRSQVILDVYHQTRNKDDRAGGYFIADFIAV